MEKTSAPENKIALQLRKISELKPFENNPKLHPPEQIQGIINSIEEFGFCAPVLIDSQDRILAGHGRVIAAQQMGMGSVPVICLSHLSPAQARAYLLVDNELGRTGYDREKLQKLLDDIDLSGIDMGKYSFDLSGLMDGLSVVAEGQDAGHSSPGTLPAGSRNETFDGFDSRETEGGDSGDGLDVSRNKIFVMVVDVGKDDQIKMIEKMVKSGIKIIEAPEDIAKDLKI